MHDSTCDSSYAQFEQRVIHATCNFWAMCYFEHDSSHTIKYCISSECMSLLWATDWLFEIQTNKKLVTLHSWTTLWHSCLCDSDVSSTIIIAGCRETARQVGAVDGPFSWFGWGANFFFCLGLYVVHARPALAELKQSFEIFRCLTGIDNPQQAYYS